MLEEQLEKLNSDLKQYKSNFSLVLTQTPEAKTGHGNPSESKASDVGFACDIYEVEEQKKEGPYP